MSKKVSQESYFNKDSSLLLTKSIEKEKRGQIYFCNSLAFLKLFPFPEIFGNLVHLSKPDTIMLQYMANEFLYHLQAMVTPDNLRMHGQGVINITSLFISSINKFIFFKEIKTFFQAVFFEFSPFFGKIFSRVL